jgi:LuxR family maltose regulon positive regulatory protein
MTELILSTRLYQPPPRSALVQRSPLLDRLTAGLENGHSLTLVSAPAGFGKTTLISAWLTVHNQRAAWLTLDEADNDLGGFLSYLVAAFQRVDGEIGEGLKQALTAARPLSVPSLLTLLINDLHRLEDALVLVLDDYHLIRDPAIHEALNFLLERQPASLHIVLITREDPPLALPRLRASGRVTEIRGSDLRFGFEEAAQFFNGTMALDLPAESIRALETRTEGWVAGMQLAALALRQDPARAEEFIASFAGDDRYIMDYLVNEVLARQPESLRRFLEGTAALDELSADLCGAVTGLPDPGAILDELYAANLFLIPLDNRRVWYRYHRLFAEFLRMGLSREATIDQHRRAAAWYQGAEMPVQGIRHALSAAGLDGDYKQARTLVEEAAEPTLLSGRMKTVRGWLDALPAETVNASPGLAVLGAWTLLLTSAPTAAGAALTQAESLFEGRDHAGRDWAQLLILKGLITMLVDQDYEAAAGLVEEALTHFEGWASPWRVMAQWVLGECVERTRPISGAISLFRAAVDAGHSLGNFFTSTAENALAAALNTNGALGEAISACEQALDRYRTPRGEYQPGASPLLSRLGSLHHEANRLEEAIRCHEDALRLAETYDLGPYAAILRGFAAPTWYAVGRETAALEALRDGYRVAAETGLSEPGWFRAKEARLRLIGGDAAHASRWAEAFGKGGFPLPDYLHIEESLHYARTLLALDRLDGLGEYLESLETFIKKRELFRWAITARLISALHADRRGDLSGAAESCAEALRLAAGEGYIRAFLDEDVRIITLVERDRGASPAFARRVLDAAGIPAGGRSAPLPGGMIEPLSEREIEVLELIAAGRRNQEIADRLTIATGTVKRHINNIYGKLAVSNRVEAIARARELRVIE